MKTEFILYVSDQQRSRDLYAVLLDLDPVLDVPGMTEFDLGGCKLGLMPEEGIAKIITPALPHPSEGGGIPRCEIYLLVDDLDPLSERAVAAGMRMIGPAADRSWGHRVVYFADPDGHVIAFARHILP
ncbi:MAG: VOC family protein [Flavobacteriales bacterium]|nr:VOC family protein [Flavobacteriales bacterium]MBP6697957.1 VOC family protein [Flavobacteriales bacterium]